MAKFTPQTTVNSLVWLVLIIGLALVVRVGWVLISQTTPVSEASVYDGLAWSLASDGKYVDKDGTPTAFRPVGYPAFLAGIYMVFGHSWTAGGIANALLGTVTVWLTYLLARTVLSIRLSLVAALLIALLPSHIFGYTSVLRMEALHTVFVLSVLGVTYWAVRTPLHPECDPSRPLSWNRHICAPDSLAIPNSVRGNSDSATTRKFQASSRIGQRCRGWDDTRTAALDGQKLLSDGCLCTDLDSRRL